MSHDPCSLLPSSAIPTGLPLHAVYNARPGAAPLKKAPQTHAVAAVTPHYLGCDHKTANHVRIKSVQMPAPVELPAAPIPRTSAIVVATLPAISQPILSFGGLPETEPQLPMPEPSSAIMFLFAVFVVLGARRLDLRRWTFPLLFALDLAPQGEARHRHRSRSIACYHAFKHENGSISKRFTEN
jgi:hypothetical protein